MVFFFEEASLLSLCLRAELFIDMQKRDTGSEALRRRIRPGVAPFFFLGDLHALAVGAGGCDWM